MSLPRLARRDPFAGIGTPEQLRHALSGTWSRRITEEPRLVYLDDGDDLVNLQARYHDDSPALPDARWASPGPDLLAAVVAMTAAEHLPLAAVKNRLSEVVDRLEREHGRVVITKHGRPAAVVLSVEDLEGLEQTLELLSDARAVRRIRQSQKDVEAGEVHELTKEQALSLVRRK